MPVMSSMRDVRGIHADRATGTTMQNAVCDNDEDENGHELELEYEIPKSTVKNTNAQSEEIYRYRQ